MFRGIQELEPGYCGFWEQGKLKLERYWYLKDGISTDSFQETVEKVRDLVMDAISRQMVSDVPIGTFLSGGLDSSIISSVCAAEMANNGKTLDTFSVGYENQEKYFVPGKFQPESDDSYIRIMADTLHSYHHSTLLTPEDLFSHLEAATLARDLPGMADVDSSLLAFCRRIRPHVKVMLSGECADEIFGGYPWYRDPEVRAREGFPWAQNTRQRVGLLRPSIGQNSEDFIREAWEKTLRDSDILPENSPEEKRMKQMVNLNFRWFMQTLLDRKDRMSMYTSLEVRVPFCDHRIAEYLYTVPWVYKDWNGKEKGLLRCAVEGLLPDRVLWRKKSPYPKTFDPRYGELVRIAFRNLLDDRASPVWEIVNREEARALIKGETMWPWYGQLMGNVQTMAYFLQIAQWIQAYQVDFCF